MKLRHYILYSCKSCTRDVLLKGSHQWAIGRVTSANRPSAAALAQQNVPEHAHGFAVHDVLIHGVCKLNARVSSLPVATTLDRVTIVHALLGVVICEAS
jgi:hypothetical protein